MILRLFEDMITLIVAGHFVIGIYPTPFAMGQVYVGEPLLADENELDRTKRQVPRVETQGEGLEQENQGYREERENYEENRIEEMPSPLPSSNNNSSDLEMQNEKDPVVVYWMSAGDCSLAKDDLDRAQRFYEEVLRCDNCNKEAIDKLKSIAHKFEVNRNYKKSIKIYDILIECQPENKEFYYRKGRLLSWTNAWNDSERVLRCALTIDPHYYDAEMALGVLFLWEGRLQQAEELFCRYPESVYAQENLGKVDLYRGKYCQAAEKFEAILKKDPNFIPLAVPERSVDFKRNAEVHREVRRCYALALSGLREYKAAKCELEKFVRDNPQDDWGWRDLFRVKHHTNYWLEAQGGYTLAKEIETPIKTEEVTDRFTDCSIGFYFPLHDQLLFRLKPFYNTQKEHVVNKINPPVEYTNYNAVLLGGIAGMNFFLPNDWSLDVLGKVKWGLGKDKPILPFQKTTRFEPCASLVYETNWQLFVLDAGYDSFIIKNFQRGVAQLLQTKFLGARYKYTFDTFAAPFFDLLGREIFYNRVNHLSNKKGMLTSIIGLGVPHLEDNLSCYYQFDYSHFDHVSPDYNSWKKKRVNYIGIDLKKTWRERTSIVFSYIHGWIYEKDFSTLAGFVVPGVRRFPSNFYYLDIFHRVGDTSKAAVFNIGIRAYHYENGFPYRENGISAKLEWVF